MSIYRPVTPLQTQRANDRFGDLTEKVCRFWFACYEEARLLRDLSSHPSMNNIHQGVNEKRPRKTQEPTTVVDDDAPLPSERMLAAGKIVFENPAHAIKAYPRLWRSLKAARQAIREQTVPLPDDLERFNYLLAGKGGHPSVAWFISETVPDAAAAIVAKLGPLASSARSKPAPEFQPQERSAPLILTGDVPVFDRVRFDERGRERISETDAHGFDVDPDGDGRKEAGNQRTSKYPPHVGVLQGPVPQG